MLAIVAEMNEIQMTISVRAKIALSEKYEQKGK